MTVLLFVATLGLQAQTTPANQQTEEQRRKDQATYGTSPASSSASTQGQYSSQNASTQGQLSSQNANEKKDNKDKQSQNPSSATASSQSQQGELKYSSNQPADVQTENQNASTSATQGSSTTTAQTGVNSSTSSQTNVAVNTQAEAEVRTVVQQIDAQGPVVVERISTRFAEVTCTEENARALVEALHNGTSVTLRGDDGQTATFTPTGHLGYGEAYIAMSLAVEALKQAGITGCASPAQWQAVLMGGELSGGTVRTTSVTTERFPGILVLREQGGWAKVAQTTNVQLSTVVSQANTNLQLNNTSSTASTTSTSGQDNLSPTGFERGHDPRATDKAGQKDEDKNKKDKKDHEDHGLKKGQDQEKAPDMENPPKTPPKY